MVAYKKINSGFLPFIEKTKTSAPFTDIVNRAKIDSSLKCSMGNERIHVNSLNKLLKESGPNGETVYGPDNGDSRVRFVGNWVAGFSNKGSHASTNSLNDYVEVSFYGTGLNMLSFMDNSANPDWRVAVDGGVEGANIYAVTSTVIGTRNYKSNMLLSIASGLSLGWHTVKIRSNENISSFGLMLFGFEILNESTQITVQSGKAHGNGYEYSLDADQLIDYKLGFDNILDADVGTRGGRAVVYLDPSDGTVKKRFTKVDNNVTGNPLAPELVTNGTFNTDITGWTNYGGASWNAGSLRITGSIPSRAAEQAITTVIGTTYALTLNFDNISNPTGVAAYAAIYTGVNATGTLLSQTSSGVLGVGTLSLSFTATAVTSYIYLSVGDNNDITEFDNISVKEIGYDFLALADTDHSNEAPYRIINWREFGRNRADDFSTLAAVTSNRAFTLDDGTTTLVGNSVRVDANDALRPATTNNWYTLTFVGTGLDIKRIAFGTNTANVLDVLVDGVSVGSTSSVSVKAGEEIIQTICSGLPYGTHTVKFTKTAIGGTDFDLLDFIVYQPKKPTLPEGAIEISDYNVMADYSVVSDGSVGNVSSGILRKMGVRESVYIGNWITPTIDVVNFNQGFNLRTTTPASYIEYSFYGTGVVYNTSFSSGDVLDVDVTIDGVANLSGFVTSINTAATGVLFAAASGHISGTVSGSNHGAIEISGLSLGFHTIRVTTNNTANMYGGTLDIITPIHSPHTTFGSRSLKDCRNFDSMKDVNKAVKEKDTYILGDGIVYEILWSKNISQVLRNSLGRWILYFEEPMFSDKYVPNNNAGSTSRHSGFFRVYKHSFEMNVQITNGAYSDAVFSSRTTGKLEKDELEE